MQSNLNFYLKKQITITVTNSNLITKFIRFLSVVQQINSFFIKCERFYLVCFSLKKYEFLKSREFVTSFDLNWNSVSYRTPRSLE